MRVTPDGWLQGDPGGAKVTRLPTVRIVKLSQPKPCGLVWHATGGVGGPRFAEGLARRIQTYRRGEDRPASWHIVIAAGTGEIFQSAPVTVGTWHVGRPGAIDGVLYPHINTVTIGVELENAGPLLKIGNSFYAHPFWCDLERRIPHPGCRVPLDSVRQHNGHFYDGFTDGQAKTAKELVIALSQHFGWHPKAFCHAHADFGAPVKTDPGPMWMTTRLPSVLSDAFTGDGPTVVTGPPNFDERASP
jgi:hypothetical protein